jgi:hypothetical protein
MADTLNTGTWNPLAMIQTCLSDLCSELKNILRTCRFDYVIWIKVTGRGGL